METRLLQAIFMAVWAMYLPVVDATPQPTKVPTTQAPTSEAPTFKGEYDVNYEKPAAMINGESCYVMPVKARVMKRLAFCKHYSDNFACCNPGIDAGIQELYGKYMNRGDSCAFRTKNVYRYTTFFQWMCLPCDPEQPKYMRGENVLLVCKEFADALYKGDYYLDWPRCGIQTPSSCNGHVGEPFDCGDDTTVPFNEWTNGQQMVNDTKMTPKNMDGLEFLVVEPSALLPGEKCFNAAASSLPSVGWAMFLILLAVAPLKAFG